MFCFWVDCRLTWTCSTSCRNLRLTDSSASCGHSWNQSMAVQLTTAGNFLLRTLSLLPTGEKHSATCRTTSELVKSICSSEAALRQTASLFVLIWSHCKGWDSVCEALQRPNLSHRLWEYNGFMNHSCSRTLSCLRTRSMKNFQQFSLVSIRPWPRTSFLKEPMMFSTSSSGKRSGISPVMKTKRW